MRVIDPLFVSGMGNRNIFGLVCGDLLVEQVNIATGDQCLYRDIVALGYEEGIDPDRACGA